MKMNLKKWAAAALCAVCAAGFCGCSGEKPMQTLPTVPETTEESIVTTEKENTDDLVMVLEDIRDHVQVGTAGSSLKAVRYALELLDWNQNTTLSKEAVRDTALLWLCNQGNDVQVELNRQMTLVEETIEKMLTGEAAAMLEESGCQTPAYAWPEYPVERIAVIMEALGVEPEGAEPEKEQWKIDFEKSLLENYGVEVDHYEYLGDGMYQAYVMIEGKIVPYVAVNSETGDYHG